MTEPGLPDGTRVRVRSSTPTPAEVAALMLALDQAAEGDAAGRSGPRRPAWQTAARLEALGGAPAASATDLRALR
jgi:hypothetical protein